MKKNFAIALMLFAGCFITLAGHSQTPEEISRILSETKVTDLLRKSSSLSAQFRLDHATALEMASRKGWITRHESPEGAIMELMRLGATGAPLYYTTHNLAAAKTVSANKVWSGGGAGLSLSGTGMVLREWDGGAVRTTHQELTGRVTKVDGALTNSDHSTHVAGTMIASGVNADAKGMSFQATLRAFEWTDDLAEMASEAAAGALLSNHSYGYISGWYYNGTTWVWYGDSFISATEDYTFGFYSDNCRDVDDIAFLSPYYLVCKSAGNDRGDYNGSGPQEMDGGADGYDCIGDMGNAKNILTVGAAGDISTGYGGPASVQVASFSSWGPSDDGRIKPDIVANGILIYSCASTANNAYTTMSGTSMASPNACGSMMLLQQHHNNLTGVFMRAATLKGLVIHTADEAGNYDGPDYRHGWGLLNIEKAALVISRKNQLSKIVETTLTSGSTYTLNVNSTGMEPMRVTICWTDPKGTPTALTLNPTTPMLVNDLDLRLNGSVQPWILNPASPSAAATTGDNTRDNVEQIYLATPLPGNHTITVTHKGSLAGGSQAFSIIVTGIYSGIADPVPFTAGALNTGQVNLSWSRNSYQNNVVLAWSSTGVFGTPANGTAYTPGNTIPGGGTVLYSGNAESFLHSGLTANTNYYYRIWSVDPVNQYSFGRTADAATPCTWYNSFPVTENFNGSALPVCWSQHASGATSDWSVNNSANAGGAAYEMMATYKAVNPGVTRLKTFFFNTTGLTSLDLSFRHLLNDYGPGATLRVQSSGDGVNWTNEAWFMNTTSNTNKGPYLVNTTITNNLNRPMTMIAFTIEGNLYQYDYWYLDNISVKAPGYWIGGAAENQTDWNTPNNWGDGLVPTSSTDVIITPRTYMPVVNTGEATPAQCNHLTIFGNAAITVNPGKKININGNVILKNDE